jgi:hypothetical protein
MSFRSVVKRLRSRFALTEENIEEEQVQPQAPAAPEAESEPAQLPDVEGRAQADALRWTHRLDR